MERRDPVEIGDERTQLTQFLDYHVTVLRMKTVSLGRDLDGHHHRGAHCELVREYWQT